MLKSPLQHHIRTVGLRDTKQASIPQAFADSTMKQDWQSMVWTILCLLVYCSQSLPSTPDIATHSRTRRGISGSKLGPPGPAPPTTLWRGETLRKFSDVVAAGGINSHGYDKQQRGELLTQEQLRGGSSLYEHQRGGTQAYTRYVSTSAEPEQALRFAGSTGTLYRIHADPKAVDMNLSLGKNQKGEPRSAYPNQAEHAFVQRIPLDQIEGYYLVTKENAAKVLEAARDDRPIEGVEFIRNPDFNAEKYGGQRAAGAAPELAGFPTDHEASGKNPYKSYRDQDVSKSFDEHVRETDKLESLREPNPSTSGSGALCKRGTDCVTSEKAQRPTDELAELEPAAKGKKLEAAGGRQTFHNNVEISPVDSAKGLALAEMFMEYLDKQGGVGKYEPVNVTGPFDPNGSIFQTHPDPTIENSIATKFARFVATVGDKGLDFATGDPEATNKLRARLKAIEKAIADGKPLSDVAQKLAIFFVGVGVNCWQAVMNAQSLFVPNVFVTIQAEFETAGNLTGLVGDGNQPAGKSLVVHMGSGGLIFSR
ncbi:hypothetical protein DCS_01714 [Drechmeria coniospora]|uniref:Heat-labile enterotoxin IIA, A chain n=1 Tax=Drechmeria coniospora TaxID=98403 RepID=A0A151GU04_DRECN|nr:hypothetical protein DCS_01714 [Drechmeria coniospora]KYK60577.1 hypothetical protein DCS_01714 [Drechmeria coniospora]